VSSNRNAAYSQQSPTLEAYPKETLHLKSTRFGVKVTKSTDFCATAREIYEYKVGDARTRGEKEHSALDGGGPKRMKRQPQCKRK
jgi:hypothetical protein